MICIDSWELKQDCKIFTSSTNSRIVSNTHTHTHTLSLSLLHTHTHTHTHTLVPTTHQYCSYDSTEQTNIQSTLQLLHWKSDSLHLSLCHPRPLHALDHPGQLIPPTHSLTLAHILTHSHTHSLTHSSPHAHSLTHSLTPLLSSPLLSFSCCSI